MNRKTTWLVLCVSLLLSGIAGAEARRDGGDDAMKKAQYMMRQMNQENAELKAQVASLQGQLAELEKKQASTDKDLAKARNKGERLEARVHSDAGKFKELVKRYRDAVNTLRLANLDNRYLVQAVDEREQWIDSCGVRNDELILANKDLLKRYEEVAGRKSDPFTGIGRVRVENEVQEYQFRIEDLQSPQFNPGVDVSSHARVQADQPQTSVN